MSWKLTQLESAYVGVKGQVGWGLEHPGLVEDVPADGRGVGTR